MATNCSESYGFLVGDAEDRQKPFCPFISQQYLADRSASENDMRQDFSNRASVRQNTSTVFFKLEL